MTDQPTQPPAPAAAPGPLAALRTWVIERRDEAARCAPTGQRATDPTGDEVPWIHEGARAAFDDVLKALGGIGEAEAAPAPAVGHHCDNCNGIDADSCLLNRDGPPQPARGIRGLLEHVGIDLTGKTVRVEGPTIEEMHRAAPDAGQVRDKDQEIRHANEQIERLTAERDEAQAALASVREYAGRLDELAKATISVRDRQLYAGIARDLRARTDAALDQQQEAVKPNGESCTPFAGSANGLDTPENGAWHTVWLEGKWRWITSRMTTPQREYAADCVARYSRYLAECDGDLERGEPEGLRWWREGAGR